LQMTGRCCGEGEELGKCIIYTFGPKKEYYKKFLHEPLPVESHLDHFLVDTVNAEVAARTINDTQDAVDYLTWTFMYRRLTMNPNYYNLQGATTEHVSDHLSELVENTLQQLSDSKLISIENDVDVKPLNLGLIASFYNLSYTTVELFSSSLKAKTKLKGLIEILCSAAEYSNIPLRQGEDKVLREFGKHLPMKVEKPVWHSLLTKVNVLLQCHFSRKRLTPELELDTQNIVGQGVKICQAMVDVISSSSYLSPALAVMELSQMITQAVWNDDSPLRQIPHFNTEMIQICKDNDINSVFDLTEAEDEQRTKVMPKDNKKVNDIIRFCNRYPDIEVDMNLSETKVAAGDAVQVSVNLTRNIEEDTAGPIIAPFFPKEKTEEWWLLVGDKKNNTLLCIKRVTIDKEKSVELEFSAPEEPGKHDLKLYLMCDSYAGCDQELDVKIEVEDGPVKMED